MDTTSSLDRSTQTPVAARLSTPYGPFEPASHINKSFVRLHCDREHRHAMIKQAAYFRAVHRGFAPGHELEDWLAAEAEVDTALTILP